MRALLLGGLTTLLAVSFSPAPSAARQGPVNSYLFKVLGQGSYGGSSLTPTDVVITSPAQWATYWQQSTGSNNPPYVDFRKEVVLGLFMGMKPTSGYSQAVTDVTSDGTLFNVFVNDVVPGPNCMVLMVITNPYLFVKTARTDLPVVFLHTPVITKC
jgi:protease stability complex PrcB-like protein